jgi:hypothetical protein
MYYRPSRTRIVLLILLALSLSLVSVIGQPKPVEAASCPSIGCGSWQYYGCCAANTKLYQRRTCCNGPTCCTQYTCGGICMF